MDGMRENGPYRLEHGDVWYSQSTVRVRPGAAMRADDVRIAGPDGMLGIAYDAADGTLHKHGRADLVQEWTDKTRSRLREAGFGDQASVLVLVCFPPVQEALDELNACIACSGRALGIQDRLAEIGSCPGGPRR